MPENPESDKLPAESHSLVSRHNVFLVQQPLYQFLSVEYIPERPSNNTPLMIPAERGEGGIVCDWRERLTL